MPDPAERWSVIAALFDQLAELEPVERERRLREIEHRDALLAADVRALLDADEDGNALLDADASSVVPGLRDDAAPSDRRAGPYRLLRPLGEGGMGVVWLAERTDGAYEQQVAVKLLKRGMDTNAILRRFLQERRILARLHHPHIVRLVDGGMSADGRPFYVMDYVDGETITQHAAAHRLDVAARVELLARVAEAVAYAHAQLVVHRDLKPSNVLVDTAGAPRVLDFGIAKLIEESGEQTRTGTGLRVLSPAYAAPEQILGEPIGTATDVYALGLMLCELLVGQLPQRRRATTPAQLAQDATQENIGASTLATNLTMERATELYGAEVTPAALSRKLSGDLDVIIATALQREPVRRYATAAAFADDLRRWLDGRPITARAESATYRLAKFVRRHRVGVAAAAVVVLSLVAGLGVALWQARVAGAEAQRADAERAHAERQLARTERVKDFMLTLFREQDPVSRAKAQARSSAELIRDGVAQIDGALAHEPDLQAELLRDLGEIQVSLDDRKNGEATLQRAAQLQANLSGADSAESAAAQAAHADGVYALGDVTRAGTMLREALPRLRSAGDAYRMKTAQAESTLATIEMIQNNYDEAERLARHAVEVYRATYGTADSRVAPLLAALGKILQERSRHADSLEAYGEALAIITRTAGEDHVRAATVRTAMGDVLRIQRKYDEALVHYEAALRIERAQLPANHTIIGSTLTRLGDLHRRTGNFDAADRAFSEAIAILARTPTGNYAQALQYYGNLARAQGKLELAAERYRASFEAFRAAVGDSIYTWLTELEVVSVLTELERFAEADVLGAEAAAAIARSSSDPDSYETAYSSGIIGALRHAQGRYADALPLLRHSMKVLAASYGEDHVEVAQARVALAACLIATHDADARVEAAALVETAKSAFERGGDVGSEPMLGHAYLERSRLRMDNRDLAGARGDIQEAIRRLQGPEHARKLRDARALARQLGVRA
jgi:serine/threonine-protein kinase